MSPEHDRPRRVLAASLAALGWGVMGAILFPVVVYLGMQAYNALTDACARGPAGDCDMAAAVFAAMSVIPGLVLGAIAGVYRVLRR